MYIHGQFKLVLFKDQLYNYICIIFVQKTFVKV